MMTWLIIGGVILLVIIILAMMYNGLVKLNQQSQEAWSDIKVQLKRRYDLIPNLINALNAQDKGVKETAQAENQFEAALKSIFAVSEAYPQLRASENFQKLQDELTDTEDKIMAARRFYNGVVRDFNTKRTVFPTNIFAAMLGFKQDKEFFELEESEMASVNKPVKAEF
jgi:LemA protein